MASTTPPTPLGAPRAITLPGPTVTATLTWETIEADLRRRGFKSSKLDGATECLAWVHDDPTVRERLRCDIYTRNDHSTWPDKEAERMGDAVERLAQLDGISPGEMLGRLVCEQPCAWVVADETGIVVLDATGPVLDALDEGGRVRDGSGLFDKPPGAGLWFWEGRVRWLPGGLEDPGIQGPVIETLRWAKCSVRDVLHGEAPGPSHVDREHPLLAELRRAEDVAAGWRAASGEALWRLDLVGWKTEPSLPRIAPETNREPPQMLAAEKMRAQAAEVAADHFQRCGWVSAAAAILAIPLPGAESAQRRAPGLRAAMPMSPGGPLETFVARGGDLSAVPEGIIRAEVSAQMQTPISPGTLEIAGRYPRLRRGSVGWTRVWALVEQAHGLLTQDETGEAWQYMGTFIEGHEFRHRSKGRHVVQVVPGDFYPACAAGAECGLAGCAKCSKTPDAATYERLAVQWAGERVLHREAPDGR